ncbi:nucleotide pyrophosphohydrolase [Opitutales bacterium]|nr:nucleotide pyrophosphohydrolase [Opitutales bacterium]
MDLQKIQEFQREFARQRDWEQFHNPKNLAMALSAEVGELLEIMQWLTPKESEEIKDSEKKKTKVSEELADITYYVLRIADILDIDLDESLWSKMKQNASKYPVELAKGNAKKYTEFHEENS